MKADNVIFYMPFDESNGSNVAYDHTSNRADGVVYGAQFVPGKNGNAISFNGGEDRCEVSKTIISNLNSSWSILAWVKSNEIELGTPKKMIWLFAFTGMENYVEMPINVNAGAWVSLAVTRREGIYTFYMNGNKIQTLTNNGTLTGVSLVQDYYGSENGMGMLDDMKMYNIELTQAEVLDEIADNQQQQYTIDGVDFKTFGVFVSGSDGILNRPKLKAPATLSWDNYHGESVDLMHKFYEPREITLSCFIKAETKMDFIKKVAAFERQFDKLGTNRLMISVNPVKPLIYEVYVKDAIEISKEWDNKLMVGTFKLKLIEPEPVKRVLKHIMISPETSTVHIGFTSNKLVNVYWGDGSVDYDLSGDVTAVHTYEQNGDYFPVITGCIDEITGFETDAIVVWERI